MRAALDTNVIISAALSSRSSPARVMQAWLEGTYELVVSELLLDELARALAYPKLRARVTEADANELVDLLRSGADLRSDPAGPSPVRSSDPDDDYLIALGAASRAVIVSGDDHLLELSDSLPVSTPAAFLTHRRRPGLTRCQADGCSINVVAAWSAWRGARARPRPGWTPSGAGDRRSG